MYVVRTEPIFKKLYRREREKISCWLILQMSQKSEKYSVQALHGILVPILRAGLKH